jgi:hypothetical protein
MWMALGPRGGGLLSSAPETMAGDRPTATISRSARPVFAPRLAATRVPGSRPPHQARRGGGGSSGVGGHLLLMSGDVGLTAGG